LRSDNNYSTNKRKYNTIQYLQRVFLEARKRVDIWKISVLMLNYMYIVHLTFLYFFFILSTVFPCPVSGNDLCLLLSIPTVA